MSCVRSASAAIQEYSLGILEYPQQKSLRNSTAEPLAVIIMGIISAMATAMNATSSRRCMASREVLAKSKEATFAFTSLKWCYVQNT